MTYVAVGATGPRVAVAVAVSEDSASWRRLGLLHFGHARVDFGRYGNKDARFFPEPVLDPNGYPALAIMHRCGDAAGSVTLVAAPEIDQRTLWRLLGTAHCLGLGETSGSGGIWESNPPGTRRARPADGFEVLM
jgi:hypothetical protein